MDLKPLFPSTTEYAWTTPNTFPVSPNESCITWQQWWCFYHPIIYLISLFDAHLIDPRINSFVGRYRLCDPGFRH
jgi:hypothetical protein